MQIKNNLHSWDIDWSEAFKLQLQLAKTINLTPFSKNVHYVAGVDISNNLYSNDIFASVVVLDALTLEIVETQAAHFHTNFPYRTGFLAFREIPALLKALLQVETPIDAILVDGHGITHPRGMGIASHLGLWVDVPTIGCAKTPLFGHFEEPPLEGGQSPIFSPKTDQLIGYALRTKKRAKPVLIAPGNHIDPESALSVVKPLFKHYRLPEPTRLAHSASNSARREFYKRLPQNPSLGVASHL